MMVLPGAGLSLYSAVVMKIYMDTFLERRKWRWEAAGWLLFIAWQTVINSHVMILSRDGILNNQNPGINLLLTIVTIEAVGLCSYQGSMWKRLLFPIINTALGMIAEGLVLFGVGYLDIKGISTILYMFLSNMVLLFIVLGIWGISIKRGIYKGVETEGKFLFIIPIVVISVYYAIYRIAGHVGIEKKEVMKWLFWVSILLIIADLYVHLIYRKMVEGYQIRKNSQMYKKQLELYKRQYQMAANATETVYQVKHDLKHDLVFISQLLLNNRYSQINEVLSGLIGNITSESELKCNTGNLAVDAQINFLWRMVKEKNIFLLTDIDIPCDMKIHDEDICILLGNALDNAIEALDHVGQAEKEKRLWVRIKYNKGVLVIKIKNDYMGNLEYTQQGRLKSKKEDNNHGIGLFSIQQISKKYKGYTSISTQSCIFTLEAVLYETSFYKKTEVS